MPATAKEIGSVSFRAATEIVSGLGSLAELASRLAGLEATRIAVIADRGLAEISALDSILASAADFRPVYTGLASVNPGVGGVEQLVAEAKAAGADGVVGIGGGSSLGAAKAVAIRLTNEKTIDSYEGVDRASNEPAPLLAIPTTAGSGSEVSNALVLHEAGRSREIVVRGRHCAPRIAILDGTVLRGLPRNPMVFAALDALSHALESLWARGRSFYSEALAERAAANILEVLPRALNRDIPSDERDKDLQRLLDASCAANLACGNSGLALVHALSSAPSIRLAHGYQNGVLLRPVAHFNEEVLAPRHRHFVAQLDAFFEHIGFSGYFLPDELLPGQQDAMVAAADGHPFHHNNLRPASTEQLREILQAAGVPGGKEKA